MTTDKPEFHLSTAQTVAMRILDLIAPACQRGQVAGSVRRGCCLVHDVDIVVWPKIEQRPATDQAGLFGTGETIDWPTALLGILLVKKSERDGYPRILKVPPAVVDSDIPVEIYLTNPDGSNWGALLQMRTGSARFNAELAKLALRKGLKYQAGYGIYNAFGRRIDDDTEAGIFETLGLPFAPPEKRL